MRIVPEVNRLPVLILLLGVLRLAGVPARSVHAAPEPPAAADAAPIAEPAPRENKPLKLDLPLVPGEPATNVRIPQYGDAAQLLSLLNSVSIKRLDDTRLELQGTDLDLNKPDGKPDFHIRLPRAIFDTRTRLLTSEEPVAISTTDFELQGERLEFDTSARCGRITGWVYMKIHNPKGILGDPEKPKAAGSPEPAAP